MLQTFRGKEPFSRRGGFEKERVIVTGPGRRNCLIMLGFGFDARLPTSSVGPNPARGSTIPVSASLIFALILLYWEAGFPGGATVTPRGPARSMAFCTKPEALASSTNSLT